MVLGKLKTVLRSMGSILGYFFKDVRRNAIYVYSSAVRFIYACAPAPQVGQPCYSSYPLALCAS